MENEACNISRWQLLKAKLDNLPSVELFSFLSDQKDFILLDVRTIGEYQSGHLPNAVHMDFLGDDFWDKFEELDKEKSYLVYCRSGRRSARVSLWMQNSGFRKVMNLAGGLKEATNDVQLVVPV